MNLQFTSTTTCTSRLITTQPCGNRIRRDHIASTIDTCPSCWVTAQQRYPHITTEFWKRSEHAWLQEMRFGGPATG